MPLEADLNQAATVYDFELDWESRYSGIRKTHLQNVAIAIDVARTLDFLDHKPQALAQPSRFARLIA